MTQFRGIALQTGPRFYVGSRLDSELGLLCHFLLSGFAEQAGSSELLSPQLLKWVSAFDLEGSSSARMQGTQDTVITVLVIHNYLVSSAYQEMGRQARLPVPRVVSQPREGKGQQRGWG